MKGFIEGSNMRTPSCPTTEFQLELMLGWAGYMVYGLYLMEGRPCDLASLDQYLFTYWPWLWRSSF